MSAISLLCLLVVAAFAEHPYPIPSEEVEFDEEGRDFFRDVGKEERKHYLGAFLDDNHASKDHRIVSERTTREALPKGFVGGWDNWKECKNTIAYIKDQAACGSCWAVAASQVVAHRTCIACGSKACSNTKEHPELLNEHRPCLDMSGEQILSCCSWCGSGCQGGYPIDAMQYWAKVGVVSGGWYGSRCGCQPYAIPPKGYRGGTPSCAQRCESGYPLSFAQDKHYATDARKVVGEEAMMEEIYHHGSIECAFSVYSNFMRYKNGIYSQQGGYFEGGHAVTVIGWGELNDGRKYWVINNSWNETWGANGELVWLGQGGYFEGGHAVTVIGWGELNDGRKYWVINNSWNETWGANGELVWLGQGGYFEGGHAVTVIGWGELNDGRKYWVINNSWNETWGANGELVWLGQGGYFEGGHAVTVIGWGELNDGRKYWVINNSWNETWGANGELVWLGQGGYFEGGHAVTVIGWGELNDGRKYWVINNSWNETWGANGELVWLGQGGYFEGGHAVTVIGWGELNDGRKYWVINNSWNETWGANGELVWLGQGGYFEGGHAVTVIGWGELNDGRKYWVINNSWNETWGANGMFFWQKGTNLLGMEGGCVAGTPKCRNHDYTLKCV